MTEQVSAIVLGVVQGLTEFLPVSSTAHLILIPWAFHWNDPLLDSLDFDVALHLGTLFAVIVYFWRDWARLAGSFFRSVRKGRADEPWEKLSWLIIVATIPGGLFGFLLEKKAETTLRSPLIIAGSLIVVGFLFILAEKLLTSRRPIEDTTLKDSLIVGFSQAVALIPGVSRSGATITAGLFAGLDREAAARFSFLLSGPIIAGACALKAKHLIAGVHAGKGGVLAAGIAASAVSGFIAIAFLIKFVKKHPITLFAWYRFALAGVILALYFVK